MTTSAHGLIPEWTLADRLRKARETTGMDQREFAEALGVSRNTVSSAENGSTVRPITIKMWALTTGISQEWLEGGTGSPTPPHGGGEPIQPSDKLTALTEAKRSRARGTRSTGRYVAAAA